MNTTLIKLQIDFQLHLEIADIDAFNSDDDIDEIVVQTSLDTSSQFSAEVEFTGDRISLFLLFRVRCTGDYMGPHCDCLPHNDTVNGYYRCEENGSISCLPGYTNTSDLCRQAGKCSKSIMACFAMGEVVALQPNMCLVVVSSFYVNF